jgi:hypothetical protein
MYKSEYDLDNIKMIDVENNNFISSLSSLYKLENIVIYFIIYIFKVHFNNFF